MERQRVLMEVQREISAELHAALVGTEHTVLVDGPTKESPQVISARLPSQAPDVDGQVFLDGPPADVRPGQLRRVRITRASDYDLVGQVLA